MSVITVRLSSPGDDTRTTWLRKNSYSGPRSISAGEAMEAKLGRCSMSGSGMCSRYGLATFTTRVAVAWSFAVTSSIAPKRPRRIGNVAGC